VIFAVRISMSLPALFQAVRMYRIRQPSPSQDDFGRTIIARGQPLTPLSPGDSAQELCGTSDLGIGWGYVKQTEIVGDYRSSRRNA
jgi:hypothetical protein